MDRAGFQQYAELFSDPILLVSATGEVLWTNRAAQAVPALRFIAGRRLHEFVEDPSEKVDDALARFARVRQGAPASLTWRIESAEGIRLLCEGAVVEPRSGDRPALLGLRVQPHNGGIARFNVLSARIDQLTREIIERRRVEDSLREIQAMLSIASQAAQIGTWDRDLRSGRVRWSPELAQIFGLAAQEAPETSEAFYDLVFLDDRERIRSVMTRAIEQGSEYEVEFRFNRADGQVRWMLGRGRAFLDENGRPWRIAGVGIDITERKGQEQALRQSEEWLRFTQRSAQAGSWQWDLRTGEAVWSEEFYQLCGHEPGTLPPTLDTWRRIVHPDDAQRIEEETRRAVAAAGNLDLEFRIRHPARGERWVVTLGRTITDGDGQPIGMAGIAIDVTERKRAEMAAQFLAEAGAELSSSLDYETTLRKVATMAVPTLADWCAVDILESGSPRRLAVMHVDPSKLQLAHDLERRWPARQDAPYGVPAVLRTGIPEVVPEITDEMLARGTSDPEHLELLRALGLRSYICVPLMAHGRVLGAVTLVAAESGRRYNEDDLRIAMELASRAATAIENARLYAAAQCEIVERRRAEQELARQSRITRTIADNAASCLFMMDEHNRPTYMNAAAVEVTGFALDDLKGRSLHETLHYQHADGSPYAAEDCPVIRAFRDRCAIRNVEDVMVRKDGSIFPVSLSLSPIVEDGVAVGAVLEFRDITEQKRAEEAIRRHAEDLARSNAELEDFAYITSHDLKEPLRGISNYAAFLLEDYSDKLDEPGREKLQTLVRLSKRMYSLLDALLEHARLGRVGLRLVECDLGEIVVDILHELGPRLRDEGVEVEVGPMPRLVCDARLVRQLLLNLVNNAVKYNTTEPRRVQIGALGGGEPGRTPVIYVRDNGIGIARQHLSTIFRMFKRLHHRDQYGGGIGFGLTIARRIVERHGGRIWAESAQGEGATFYFTLEPGRGPGPGERFVQPEQAAVVSPGPMLQADPERRSISRFMQAS